MPRILAVGTSVPDFVVTNDYVISLALEHSRRFYNGNISELEVKLQSLLDKAGSKRRRWRAGFTKPHEHISDAWLNCTSKLDTSVLTKIGTLIYCGIDKGVVEPSHASLIAKKLGLTGIRTLDVSDACMGWFSAAQIAPRLASIEMPYCAIVSAEFPIEVPGKVYPESFKIKNDDDLLWKGAALTLGECAAVTIIDASYHPTEFAFRSNNDFADLCGVPLERPERFVDSIRMTERFLDNCFISHIGKLTAATYRTAREVLSRYIAEYGVPDTVLSHTVSQTGPRHASQHLIEPPVLKNCFEIFGNISTCSIPVAYEYFDCTERSDLHVIGWISAAGISCSAFRIV